MPVDKTPLTDKSPMPFGEHKGIPMEDVPKDYLYELSTQKWIAGWPGLATYLTRNMDLISKEAEELIEQEDEQEGYSSYEDYRRDIRN